jgi:hypothetical protein
LSVFDETVVEDLNQCLSSTALSAATYVARPSMRDQKVGREAEADSQAPAAKAHRARDFPRFLQPLA